MGEKGEEQLQSQTQHKGLFWQCGSRIQYLKQTSSNVCKSDEQILSGTENRDIISEIG